MEVEANPAIPLSRTNARFVILVGELGGYLKVLYKVWGTLFHDNACSIWGGASSRRPNLGKNFSDIRSDLNVAEGLIGGTSKE